MTKKMLQGIAIGILFTTILFATNLSFSDNPQGSPTSEPITITEEMVEQYTKNEGLVVITKEEYEQFLAESIALEELKEGTHEITFEKIIVKEIMVTINPGTSTGSVAGLLEEKGIINSKEQFEAYLIRQGLETKIKAGVYILRTDMTFEEIAEKLT